MQWSWVLTLLIDQGCNKVTVFQYCTSTKHSQSQNIFFNIEKFSSAFKVKAKILSKTICWTFSMNWVASTISILVVRIDFKTKKFIAFDGKLDEGINL